MRDASAGWREEYAYQSITEIEEPHTTDSTTEEKCPERAEGAEARNLEVGGATARAIARARGSGGLGWMVCGAEGTPEAPTRQAVAQASAPLARFRSSPGDSV